MDGRKVDPGYMEGILMDYMDISGIKGVELPVAAYIVMIDVLLLQDKSFQVLIIAIQISNWRKRAYSYLVAWIVEWNPFINFIAMILPSC